METGESHEESAQGKIDLVRAAFARANTPSRAAGAQ